ncbi:uncharacterized protein TNCV_750761 [Trichonephila clavipes]|nr:uncharacterized protein TNCV_750761 [Trichonephila clavipes]
MNSRRNKEKFEQLTEFKRGSLFGLREGGFSYLAIGAHVQRNSSIVIRVWKQWIDEHQTTRKTGRGRRKQDKARLHVAKTVRDFCSAQHMQLLPWPAYSPDMSPIEHEWIWLVGVWLVIHVLQLHKTNFCCAYEQYRILFRKQTFKFCLTPCHVV